MTYQNQNTDIHRKLRRAPHWFVVIGLFASAIGLLIGVNVWFFGVLLLGHEIAWALPLLGYSAAGLVIFRLAGMLTARLAGVRP